MTAFNDNLPPDIGSLRTPHKGSDLVIAPTWRDGDWNSHAVDCPFVFRRAGRLGMTVVGWDGVGYQTGLAWHDDGGWSAPELVFPRDPNDPHRRYNAALTSILRDNALRGPGELRSVDGWYVGTFHAYPAAGYEQGSGVIGLARSRDLRTWQDHRVVLRPEEGGAWERGGLYKSWLMEHEGSYWLFYNAKDRADSRWVEQTGAAVSDDLVTWRRVSDEPLLRNGPAGSFDERFASDPCVLRDDDGRWVMFYFGLSARGQARDSVAVSTDLVAWQRTDEILVDVGEPGSLDDAYAHKPAVITADDGALEHYYCAVQRLPEPVMIGEYAQRERRGIAVARSLPR